MQRRRLFQNFLPLFQMEQLSLLSVCCFRLSSYAINRRLLYQEKKIMMTIYIYKSVTNYIMQYTFVKNITTNNLILAGQTHYKTPKHSQLARARLRSGLARLQQQLYHLQVPGFECHLQPVEFFACNKVSPLYSRILTTVSYAPIIQHEVIKGCM